MKIERVDYSVLDRAKQAFIQASRRTLGFARAYGFVPKNRLGASANVFSLNLRPFLKKNAGELFVTLLPEGLGTADDARPDDLGPAELARFWRNIGIKTVAVMTNDAAASGMQTILISLYLPSSEPHKVFGPHFMKGFLKGFVEGCRKVGSVYFSGETPELKTKILPGRLDIAGALFGILPAGRAPIASSALKNGDTIVFVESSGPHENGFTTLRSLAAHLPKGYRTLLPGGREFWEAINAPSKLYTPFIQAVLAAGIHPTNVEPITGHGWQKLMRSAQPFSYVIENMLPVLPIFQFVQKASGLSAKEMVQIFNYGVGLAVFARTKSDAGKIVRIAAKNGLRSCVAGFVAASKKREVVIKPLKVTLSGDSFGLHQ